MAKSIKLKNNVYWDSTGIVHNRNKLSTFLENLLNKKSNKSTELYNSNSGNGTNGTVNLSDNVSNYLYLVIDFRVGTTRKSVRYNVRSNQPWCMLDFIDYSDGYLQFFTKTVKIQNNTIVNERYKKYTIQDSERWIPYGSNENAIYIVAVYGYTD